MTAEHVFGSCARGRRLAALAATALLAAACGQGGSDGQGGGDVVPIGYIGPLSGGAAYYGRNVQRGLQMAADEITEAGGIEVGGKRMQIEVVSMDDRYLPYETATAARRLLQQRRPSVIFVPHAGGIRALEEINTDDPKFLLAAYSSEPSILAPDDPLMIMLPPRFDSYQEPFVRVEMQQFGKRLGLVPTTTAYGKAWTEKVTAEWRRQGGTVGGDHGVDYNTTTDFTGAVSRALADDPDVLFVGGPSQPTALVIKAAREQGFQGGFLIMDQAKFEEMVEIVPMEALEGSIGVYPQPTYPIPAAPAFAERYYERYGHDDGPPTSEVAINYQTLHVIAHAMELAGTTTDPEAIRAKIGESMTSLPEDLKVLGLEGVDSHGYMQRPVYAAHVVDGKYEAVEIPPLSGAPEGE